MEAKIAGKYEAIAASLNERQRRMWGAIEAQALGYGGVTKVSRATGISRRAIHAGLKELANEMRISDRLIRRKGGGRKQLTQNQPDLLTALDALVEPTARGDPDSPLRWVCKSTRQLAEELHGQGFVIERQSVCALLAEMGYSLQANRKVKEGRQHPGSR